MTIDYGGSLAPTQGVHRRIGNGATPQRLPLLLRTPPLGRKGQRLVLVPVFSALRRREPPMIERKPSGSEVRQAVDSRHGVCHAGYTATTGVRIVSVSGRRPADRRLCGARLRDR